MAAPFSVAYIVIAAIPVMLNNFAKCPRCGKYFNMFDPFDWRMYDVAPDPGPGNCIYCRFPFNKKKKGRLYRFEKKMNKVLSKILHFSIPLRKKKK